MKRGKNIKMNWKEFFKPKLERIIILLIVFTFFPWPRQIYITPNFFISFLFYGPITLAKILSISLQLGTTYGASTSISGRLFSNQILLTYLNLIIVIFLSYLLSCFISHKTTFLKPTKIKSVISFSILLILFTALLILFLSRGLYNENALSLNIMVPLALFSILYVVYSLFENKNKKLR